MRERRRCEERDVLTLTPMLTDNSWGPGFVTRLKIPPITINIPRPWGLFFSRLIEKISSMEAIGGKMSVTTKEMETEISLTKISKPVSTPLA